MATNLLWFVIAGFLLGFATSTLWEWFYFRKERLKLTDQRIRELEAKLREPETILENRSSTSSTPEDAAEASPSSPSTLAQGGSLTSTWGEAAYRSPGVFLETEEAEDDDGGFAPEHDDPPPIRPSTTASRMITASPTPVPMPVSQPEKLVSPRSEQSPADALRSRRGDPPRSRQEVLAALRRNSNPGARGQPLRTEAEQDDKASAQPEPTTGETRPDDLTLAEPTPAQPTSAKPTQIEPTRAMFARESRLVTSLPPDQEELADASGTEASPAPAVAQPAEITEVRKQWIQNPELTQPSQEYPDDLSKIKGIGGVYKQRLYHAGIYTWQRYALSDIETLRRATSAYPSSNVDEWLVQAQKLIEKHGRADAVYRGPQPDDLTKILGVGPVSAAALYRAGICTYEQLACVPIADLEALFPIAVAGDQPDFEQWVARAANLADDKHRDG